MQDRIDGFASVSLEEHDAERGMLQRRVDNVVRPLGPLDQELLASDSEGAFIDQAMIRKHLVGMCRMCHACDVRGSPAGVGTAPPRHTGHLTGLACLDMA